MAESFTAELPVLRLKVQFSTYTADEPPKSEGTTSQLLYPTFDPDSV